MASEPHEGQLLALCISFHLLPSPRPGTAKIKALSRRCAQLENAFFFLVLLGDWEPDLNAFP